MWSKVRQNCGGGGGDHLYNEKICVMMMKPSFSRFICNANAFKSILLINQAWTQENNFLIKKIHQDIKKNIIQTIYRYKQFIEKMEKTSKIV